MIEVGRTSVRLLGLEIHWYALLIVTGMCLGLAVAWRRERRLDLPKDTALDLVLLGIPAAVLGARLYYVLFQWRSFAGGPWWKIFAVWEGGLAVYGGILGGLLAGWFYARRKRLSYAKLLDLTAPGFALGQAVGRWGNFINQEAHGGPVTDAALRFFPAAVHIGGEWYYATFFYESVWCLLIAVFLLRGERRGRFARTGDMFAVYAFLYALERAVVEGLRTDSLYLGPVRVSQALSLLIALGVVIIWARRAAAAPMALRLLAPACVLLAAGFAAADIGFGMLAAAASAIAAAAAIYKWNDSTNDQTQNRGEGL